MSSPFELATAIEPAGDGVFRVVVPDGWQQGKGAFGGLVIGALARAILASERDPSRRLRSLSADLPAPAMPVASEIHVRELRRGGSMSFIDATLLQHGAIVARASATLAAPRALPPADVPLPAAPRLPAWEDVVANPIGPPLGPVFAQHYEYRSTGTLPFSGAGDATTEGWLREKLRPTVIDEPQIIGLLDAWWPAVYGVSPMPRPAATVGYTMQLLADPRELSTERPLAYRARAVVAHDNFVVEMRELWSGDRPIALNQQTFALLG